MHVLKELRVKSPEIGEEKMTKESEIEIRFWGLWKLYKTLHKNKQSKIEIENSNWLRCEGGSGPSFGI